MKQPFQIDLGTVHIHKNVIAEIIGSAIADIEGVSLIPKNFIEEIIEIFRHTFPSGSCTTPGIFVHIDENSDVSVEIKVFVRYGMNIPDIGRHIQDVVRSMVQKTVDISLKEINVNIQGIERGNP